MGRKEGLVRSKQEFVGMVEFYVQLFFQISFQFIIFIQGEGEYCRSYIFGELGIFGSFVKGIKYCEFSSVREKGKGQFILENQGKTVIIFEWFMGFIRLRGGVREGQLIIRSGICKGNVQIRFSCFLLLVQWFRFFFKGLRYLRGFGDMGYVDKVEVMYIKKN